MAGQRVAKKEGGSHKGPFFAAVVFAVLAAAYIGLCAWVGGTGIMPNVSIAGLDVAGMTWDEAQAVVDQAMEEHGAQAAVKLTYGDWSGTITGDQLDTFGENSARYAAQKGKNNFLTRGVQYLGHLIGTSSDVSLDLGLEDVEQNALTALLNEADQAVGGSVTSAAYAVQGEELVVTKGITGVSVDREKAKEAVFQAFQEEALPGAFQGQQTEVTVALEVVETPPQEPEFDGLWRELSAEAKDAVMDETYTITDHVVGVDFDVNALKAAYTAAAEGETFTVPLTITQPKDTKEGLKAKLFKNLLGQATSRVGGSSNRKTNVKLSAAACNGVILLPGQEFSYNNTTGSRSADKGYLPAGVYVGGVSMDEVGGGICQTSSTIYYAVLHTTLEIVERHDHKFAVGYVPDGMDATVYYGSLDFRFKNNTNYPVKVVTESYDKNGSRYLTVKLYGTNETGRYAVPERVQYDWVEPTVKYQADGTVPQGTLVLDTKQNAYTGLKAKTYRYIYEKNGSLVEKQNLGVSTYDMRPHLYRYNPLDGDPATWPNGQPPKPVVEPVAPPVTEPVIDPTATVPEVPEVTEPVAESPEVTEPESAAPEAAEPEGTPEA